ncbi:capZ-interacting protein-like isoform X2 [Esox lucius]|uniref:FAM21/CAPZIP domain-containing protein n=1 Tax=Esox lucius TaxID=8010 RepID=A0AAY5KJM7_ESOLU|nr:capZ-interacting protein-like isoform X2 [Esox lucius]
MEEDVPPKKSVAELAGKFKSHAIPIPTGTEGKPISPSQHASKTKRNSALIEKLQANLVISPAALMPSHKSPGLRLLPPSFSPVSPCSPTLPVTMVNPTSPVSRVPRARSQSKEEIPTTFENPAKPTEGSLLPSINKGRARLSIRRRPPSRRHRKSSGEEDGGAAESDTPLSPNNTPDSVGEDEKKEGGEVFQNKHKNEEETDNTPKADTEPISVTSTNSQQQPVTDGTTTDIDLLNKTKTGSFLEPQREENQERKTGAERQTGATESRGEGKACGQGCGEEKDEKGILSCSILRKDQESNTEEGKELACKEREAERDTD